MSDGAVHIKNLVKTYLDEQGNPSFTAVKNINLEIQDGEFMVLVGPSGCGKSTTLRMLAGLENITSGTIAIGERVVNNVHPKDRGIAMVFQNYALYPHMTIFDNIAFGLKLAKKPKDFIQQTVTKTAKSLGLDKMLEARLMIVPPEYVLAPVIRNVPPPNPEGYPRSSPASGRWALAGCR